MDNTNNEANNGANNETNSGAIIDVIYVHIVPKVKQSILKSLRCCKTLNNCIRPILLSRSEQSIYNYLNKKLFTKKHKSKSYQKLYKYYKQNVCQYYNRKANITHDQKLHLKSHKKLYKTLSHIYKKLSMLLSEYFVSCTNLNIDFNLEDLASMSYMLTSIQKENIYYSLLLANTTLTCDYLSFISFDVALLNINNFVPEIHVQYLTMNYIQTSNQDCFNKLKCDSLTINYDPLEVTVEKYPSHDYMDSFDLEVPFVCKSIMINITETKVKILNGNNFIYEVNVRSTVDISLSASAEYLIIKNNNKHVNLLDLSLNNDNEVSTIRNVILIDFNTIKLRNSNTNWLLVNCSNLRFSSTAFKMDGVFSYKTFNYLHLIRLYIIGQTPLFHYPTHTHDTRYKTRQPENVNYPILRRPYINSISEFIERIRQDHMYCITRSNYSNITKKLETNTSVSLSCTSSSDSKSSKNDTQNVDSDEMLNNINNNHDDSFDSFEDEYYSNNQALRRGGVYFPKIICNNIIQHQVVSCSVYNIEELWKEWLGQPNIIN